MLFKMLLRYYVLFLENYSYNHWILEITQKRLLYLYRGITQENGYTDSDICIL